MADLEKQWEVETIATVRRVRVVTAADEKAAEAASVDAEIEHEEDISEETVAIRPTPDQQSGGGNG